jgi:hypothetical protein
MNAEFAARRGIVLIQRVLPEGVDGRSASRWANWTALTYQYETQPIPAWTSWYAHQLSASMHYWSTAGMFVIELLVPWLVFLPPRFRRVRAAAAARWRRSRRGSRRPATTASSTC